MLKFFSALLAIIVLTALGIAVLATADTVKPTETVLVGTGCDGPSDIAVAIEEDMMPWCERIEVHTVDRSY